MACTRNFRRAAEPGRLRAQGGGGGGPQEEERVEEGEEERVEEEEVAAAGSLCGRSKSWGSWGTHLEGRCSCSSFELKLCTEMNACEGGRWLMTA